MQSGSTRLQHNKMGLSYLGGPTSRTDDVPFGAAVAGRDAPPSLTLCNLAFTREISRDIFPSRSLPRYQLTVSANLTVEWPCEATSPSPPRELPFAVWSFRL